MIAKRKFIISVKFFFKMFLNSPGLAIPVINNTSVDLSGVQGSHITLGLPVEIVEKNTGCQPRFDFRCQLTFSPIERSGGHLVTK